MKKNSLVVKFLLVLAVAALSFNASPKPTAARVKPTRTPRVKHAPTRTRTPGPTAAMTSTTASIPTGTLVSIPTGTGTSLPTANATSTRTATLAASMTATPSTTATSTPGTGGFIQPYPNAPLCADSGTTTFHTLWDGRRGCHYDHEHGANPFTPAVAAAFPGFTLLNLLGHVEIGHSDPSSPAENTAKHGGMKWQVDLHAPQGCAVGFEDGTVAVDAYAIQYHVFGRQDVELEARQHSAAALLRQCKPGAPSDKGYIYVVQLSEFGQRVVPYQGFVLPYPNNPLPAYDSPSGPYFTTDCIGTGLPGCRPDLDYVRARNLNANTIWTSKSTGAGPRPPVSSLFRMLFRARDTYQLLDSADLVYPFTWRFICGNTVYNPADCRYNNSTTTIHEVAGDIPAAWDGLAGFDTDARAGRITAQGFVTRYGTRNTACTAANPDLDCYPIKMVGAFVGKYSSELSLGKVSNPTPTDTPERDIYFCNGVVCSETSPNAVPSGWIGVGN